jgi:hypothetical protein
VTEKEKRTFDDEYDRKVRQFPEEFGGLMSATASYFYGPYGNTLVPDEMYQEIGLTMLDALEAYVQKRIDDVL